MQSVPDGPAQGETLRMPRWGRARGQRGCGQGQEGSRGAQGSAGSRLCRAPGALHQSWASALCAVGPTGSLVQGLL